MIPAIAEGAEAAPIYVSVELSKRSWLVFPCCQELAKYRSPTPPLEMARRSQALRKLKIALAPGQLNSCCHSFVL
jgi:hypothetical protein